MDFGRRLSTYALTQIRSVLARHLKLTSWRVQTVIKNDNYDKHGETRSLSHPEDLLTSVDQFRRPSLAIKKSKK
jgi:hypothetical protein